MGTIQLGRKEILVGRNGRKKSMHMVTGRLGLKAEDPRAQARWRRWEPQLGGPDREGVRAGGLQEAEQETRGAPRESRCRGVPVEVSCEGRKKALLSGESCLTWHLCVSISGS